MPGKREDAWIKAKETFVSLALKEGSIRIGRERLVAPWLEKRGPAIVEPLRTCDAIDAKFESGFRGGKPDLSALKGQLDDFAKEAAEYTRVCGDLITGLQTSIDKLKATDNAKAPRMKDNLIRGLKVLKTQLNALDQSNASWQATARTRLESWTNKMTMFEMMAKNWAVVLKAALARGLAGAQRIKADPKPATYNNEFPTAAREITQQIGNVGTLTGKGFAIPGPKDPKALFDALKPFANGNLVQLPDNATRDQVLAAVKQFNKAVKAVAEACRGVL
jgi:hypothetical protein